MRRAALIATALTVPVVVILALALAPSDNPTKSGAEADPTAVVSVNAPTPSPNVIEPCAQVLSQLPVQLDGLNPRQVNPYPDDGASVVAWGNPPVVLNCGVSRPSALVAGSSALITLINAVNWLPVKDSKQTVFTVVDRAVYIEITVPSSYAQPPLATISDAIAKALPTVCHFDSLAGVPATTPSVGPLCTQRP